MRRPERAYRYGPFPAPTEKVKMRRIRDENGQRCESTIVHLTVPRSLHSALREHAEEGDTEIAALVREVLYDKFLRSDNKESVTAG